MKLYLVVLFIFMVAFAGLATGLILKRRGLRGGCRPAPGSENDCQCKSATRPEMTGQGDQHNSCDI